MRKKLFKILICIVIFAGIFIIPNFIVLVGYDMRYSENTQTYTVNNVIFGSRIRDYQNIAFEPNKKGFRKGCYWLNAFMDTRYDVTVNNYDTYLVYKNKTVLLSQTNLGQKVAFQESDYTTPHFQSSSAGISEIFYIPDSELKKIKGVKFVANVTVSDDLGSVTQNIEFEYKTEYRGYSRFEAMLRSV